MNKITLIFFIALVVTSTSSYAYTYKCRNEAGKIIYSGSPCSPAHIEMHEETIAINGQRRLTSDQLDTIRQHNKEVQAERNRKAEQLRSIDVDKLRASELEAEKLRSNKKKRNAGALRQ
jgi:hypothetical protein